MGICSKCFMPPLKLPSSICSRENRFSLQGLFICGLTEEWSMKWYFCLIENLFSFATWNFSKDKHNEDLWIKLNNEKVWSFKNVFLINYIFKNEHSICVKHFWFWMQKKKLKIFSRDSKITLNLCAVRFLKLDSFMFLLQKLNFLMPREKNWKHKFKKGWVETK